MKIKKGKNDASCDAIPAINDCKINPAEFDPAFLRLSKRSLMPIGL